MSLTLRTNRWASRTIIILHLVIWNAVGIVLLQKGISTLQRRMLETNHIIETNSSIDLSIESTTFSIKHAGNEYDLAIISAQQQLIDRNDEKIIIRIDPESSLNNDRKHPKLNVIRQALRNELEIASEEERSALFLSNPLENSTTDDENLRPESKNAPNKILRIVRDREHIFGNRISKILKNLYSEENNITSSLESASESKEEEGENNRDDATRKDVNSAEDASTKLFSRENDRVAMTNNNNNILRRGSSRIKFSHNGGAVTAVAMVAIGAIMLLVGPIVIILRILDERRQARKLYASSAVREDLPPTYEQAVFSSEAPRYSTLALNDDDNNSPPPSPTLTTSHLLESRDQVVTPCPKFEHNTSLRNL